VASQVGEVAIQGRCPFPAPPSPKPKLCSGSSVEKKSLSTNENTDIFYGLVKTTQRDISIVAETGTFQMWYDIEGRGS